MDHVHLLLHHQRSAELQARAREHARVRACVDLRRAERLSRRAARLLERAAVLAGPAVRRGELGAVRARPRGPHAASP